MLLMKKTYFDAIRRGDKTTTLRYWQRRHVRPGSIHKVRGLGRLRIDDVRVVDFSELTDAHAVADGLADLASLKTALDTLYAPGEREGRELYLVEFTFLPEDTE